jgi:hypothetical protein
MSARRYIVLLALLLSLHVHLQAQPDTAVCPRARYDMHRLQWDNAWINGENAAALIYNPDYNLSSLEAGTDYRAGDFKNVYDPRYDNNYRLNATSYLKLGTIRLHGKFGYSYNIKRDIQWYGLVDPYSTPLLMADSVPGNYNLEQFYLRGGMAVPLSAKWTAGVYMDYTAAAGGKNKDLRNSNMYMHFALRPSVLFRHGAVAAGLSATYDRQRENVDYSSYGIDPKNQYLYFYEGMWFYQREALSVNTESSRLKSDESFGGALQLEIKTTGFRFYNEFNALHTSQKQQYNSFREFGDVTQWRWGYNGSISFRQQVVNLSATLISMQGFSIVQHKEYHEASQAQQWVTDFTSPVYTRDVLDATLDYTFVKTHPDKSVAWEATVGAHGAMWDMERTANPYTIENWRYVEGFLRGIKKWYLGSNILEIRPAVYFRTGGGLPEEAVGSSGGSGLRQQHDPLMLEFNYMTATAAGAGLCIRYAHSISEKNNHQFVYIETGGTYMRVLSGDMNGASRANMQLSVGFGF